MKRIILVAAMVTLFSGAAAADEFRCGKDYITFQTTGVSRAGPTRIITAQKRVIIFIVKSSNGERAVVMGRDGVPTMGTNHITLDTYRRILKCLY